MSEPNLMMTSGDCLVIARHDGLFDVFKLWAEGSRQRVDLEIVDRHAALRIARTRLEPDGSAVYFKEEAEPDSAIRPCSPHTLRITYAEQDAEVAV